MWAARKLTDDEKLVYKPMLFASAAVHFVDAKTGVDDTIQKSFISSVTGDGAAHNWSDAQVVKHDHDDLGVEPLTSASFEVVPPGLAQVSNYKAWAKDLAVWLCQSQKYYLLFNPDFNMYSDPGETEGAFRVRVQQRSNELRDEASSKLRAKYAPKLNSLQERIRVAEQKLERETQASREHEVQSAISIGATILGAIVSRRPISSTTLGKASSAAKGVGRASMKRQDAMRAGETLQSLHEQLSELEAQFRSDMNSLQERIGIRSQTVQPIAISTQENEYLSVDHRFAMDSFCAVVKQHDERDLVKLMSVRLRIFVHIVLFLFLWLGFAYSNATQLPSPQNPILATMNTELKRSLTRLKSGWESATLLPGVPTI